MLDERWRWPVIANNISGLRVRQGPAAGGARNGRSAAAGNGL